MRLILDPPIWEVATAEQLEAFMEELDELEPRYQDDPDSLAEIRRARTDAERWLKERRGE